MRHPNEDVIRRAYDAVNAGDVAAFASSLAPDVVWHGGQGQITGADAVGELIGQMRDAAGGTLDVELHDVLANDEHAVALQVTRAERGGRSLADRVVYVFHMRNGKIAEAWFNGDPRAQDEFWR